MRLCGPGQSETGTVAPRVSMHEHDNNIFYHVQHNEYALCCDKSLSNWQGGFISTLVIGLMTIVLSLTHCDLLFAWKYKT